MWCILASNLQQANTASPQQNIHIWVQYHLRQLCSRPNLHGKIFTRLRQLCSRLNLHGKIFTNFQQNSDSCLKILSAKVTLLMIYERFFVLHIDFGEDDLDVKTSWTINHLHPHHSLPLFVSLYCGGFVIQMKILKEDYSINMSWFQFVQVV